MIKKVFTTVCAGRLAKTGLLLIICLLSLSFAKAQDVPSPAKVQDAPSPAKVLKVACLSYDSVLHAMADYAQLQQQLAQLREQYEAEQKRVERDFNAKYEEFLDGQRDFPQTILQKRQSELQELMEKNIQFRDESRRLLAAAEKDALQPLHDKIAATLRRIGQERGYAFILNTDSHGCPYLNPELGENITAYVIEVLAGSK